MDGVLGSVTPEGAAEQCPRERIVRAVGARPQERQGGKAVLRAYVSGVPACDKVPVTLAAPGREVADRRTDAARRAGTAVFRQPGQLRALAPRVVRADLACLKATSPRWTARPAAPG